MSHEREVKLISKSQNIHYMLTIKSWDYLPKRCIKADIFIVNSDCNKWTKTWADLSGYAGDVAIAPIEWSGYRYSIPKWVRKVIWHELRMEGGRHDERVKAREVA